MNSIITNIIDTSNINIKHVSEPLLILILLGGIYRFFEICSRSIGEKIQSLVVTLSGLSIALVILNIYWLMAQSPYNLDSPEAHFGGGIALFILFVHDWLILLRKDSMRKT